MGELVARENTRGKPYFFLLSVWRKKRGGTPILCKGHVLPSAGRGLPGGEKHNLPQRNGRFTRRRSLTLPMSRGEEGSGEGLSLKHSDRKGSSPYEGLYAVGSFSGKRLLLLWKCPRMHASSPKNKKRGKRGEKLKSR